jgi:hypothetical protein
VSEPPRKPSRLETELNDILAKADRPPSPIIQFKARARRRRYAWLGRRRSWRPRFEASRFNLLLLTIGLAVLAVIVSQVSPILGKFLAYASIGVLVWLLARSLIRPKSASGPKRWRGRDIDV